MGQNGKGDIQRPLSVSREVWERNYDMIDWNDHPTKQQEEKQEVDRPKPTRSR